MKIYILGGSGMLGTVFIQHFSEHHDVYAPASTLVDICNFSALNESIGNYQPDVVINLAALCDMEACESKPEMAIKIHAHGSANAALIADRVGATYVYLSSACVFDGDTLGYSVGDSTRPISVYGKTKLLGENAARSVTKHIVIRTDWCFGGGREHDKKFIGKIFRQIERGQKISAVDDKRGTPSYLPDLAFALEKLLERKDFGTFHITCDGSASRYEMAVEFVRLLGRDIEVERVDSSHYEHFAIYSAPRPKFEVLLNSKIDGFTPRHWKDALAEYVKEFREGYGRYQRFAARRVRERGLRLD